MPQVPILQGPSVKAAPQQGGFLDTPDVSSGLKSLAAGLGAAGNTVEKVVQRQDNDVALSTDAQIKTSFAAFDADLRKQSQGNKAVGYADKVNQWWADTSKDVGEKLTPNQKAIINRSLVAAQVQSNQAALGWQNGELDRSETDSFNAAQIAEIQRGASSGDPGVAATSVALLKARNAARSVQKGLGPEELEQMNMKATTALHVNFLQGMQQKDPTAALAYYNANKDEIDGTRHAEIEHSLNTASAAVDGMAAGQDIWQTLGPKVDGQPVELDKMEAAARAKFGGPAAQTDNGYGKRADGSFKGKGFLGELKRPDGSVSTEITVGVEINGKETDIPTLVPGLTKDERESLLRGDRPTDAIVQKAVDHAKARLAAGQSVFADNAPSGGTADKARLDATISDIRERAAAQNAAERERAASNTNSVMLAYSKGMGINQLKTLPAFAALPGVEQAKIIDHVEDRNYSQLLRANAGDARADAAEAREQRKLGRDGFAGYLAYSNPDTLSKMSETEVQALLPVLGNELTGHLLDKKRSMSKSPLKESEAKMDTEDFNHAAESMGLKPYEKKTDEEKAQLGETKYRVEQLIYAAQESKKAPLTRAEKTELMTQELARTVKVDGGWFSSNTDKPVMSLTKDDIKDVIIPDTDRKQIAAAMQAKYAATKKAIYAPTDANMRRFYLVGKSTAANLLPTDAQ